MELHQAVAAGQFLGHFGGQFPVAEIQMRAGLHFFAWPHQAFPGLVALVVQQQDLAGAAARLPVAQETRRQDAGIVHDQAVARAEQLG